MKISCFKSQLLVFAILLLFSYCKGDKQTFVIKGTVANADTLTLYLERRNPSSNISVLDSVKLDAQGSFEFKEESLGYTEFYRLRLNDQFINLSIDSTEILSVKADKDSFGESYSVDGSASNTLIQEVVLSHKKLLQDIGALQSKQNNKIISDKQYVLGLDSLITNYKSDKKQFILTNLMSPAAYYALFQKVGDYLIFDPNTKSDIVLYQAVGTNWNEFRPKSPRSEQLNTLALTGLANIRAEKNAEKSLEELVGKQTTVDESEFYAVELPNLKNEMVSSKSLKGKVYLLDFTAYQMPYSVAHNMALNKVYQKHKSNMEIYQISFDDQKHVWQNAANNLPWIAVWDSQSLRSPLVAKFNVFNLPTTFLVDKDGVIVKRLDPNANLETEIAKIL